MQSQELFNILAFLDALSFKNKKKWIVPFFFAKTLIAFKITNYSQFTHRCIPNLF